MKCVFIHVDGTMENVDVNIDTNDHGKLLGGPVNIVGQMADGGVPVVIISAKHTSDTIEVNAHKLPCPLHEEVVVGPMMALRMFAGFEHDLTVSEYTEFLAGQR